MKQRLRNYISVVTALSLCLGLWFGTGQIIKAEGTQQGTLHVTILGDETSVKEIGIEIENFTAEGEDFLVCTGTFALNKEQVKCDDEKYLLYWYTGDSPENLSEIENVGNGGTEGFHFDLGSLTKEKKVAVTYDGNSVTLSLYAEKGSKHTAIYDSNNENSKTAERYFYQDSLNTGSVSYDHPQTPTFDGETWTKAGYQFTGWGVDVGSGGIESAPLNFEHQYPDTDRTFLALWEEIKSIASGTYNLASGKSYSLTSGTWVVNDGADGCTYTGDREFYVEEGEYKFTSQ